MTHAIKTDKMSIRVSSDVKTVLNEAAALYDITLSDFVVQSALRMAKTALSESQGIKLNSEEWTALLEKMERPAKKHARLAKLFSE